jgi:hypothetical protein
MVRLGKLQQNISEDIADLLLLCGLLLLLRLEGVRNRENELGDGCPFCSDGSSDIMTTGGRLR